LTDSEGNIPPRPHRRAATLTALLSAVLGAVLLSGCSSNKVEEYDADADAAEIYQKAQRALDLGNYGFATTNYEYLMAVYPFSEYAKQGQLDLMYAYYRNRQPDSAIDAADKFILENPTHPRVDYAHYIKGLATFERKRGPLERLMRVDLAKRPPDRLEESYRAFGVVAERFPDSPYAEDSRQRMVYLRNRLAQYEIHVAAYYIHRGAWVAAANRAKYVLENYQQTPSVVPALQIMVTAYRQLELTELADDSMRVLEENYPAEAVAYGARGSTGVEGTLIERFILRRNQK
jgi:outer membrane protein assembly factor BamD